MKNMESLNKLIRHAYETVPFYKELLEEEECLEIEKLPIVDKQQMIESGRSMLSTRYMGQYLTKQLKWTRTSGSSGMIHEIFWNKVDERKSMMGLWFLRWKYYKVSPAQKLCFFSRRILMMKSVWKQTGYWRYQEKVCSTALL